MRDYDVVDFTKVFFINIAYWVGMIAISLGIAIFSAPNKETLFSWPVLIISLGVTCVIYKIMKEKIPML